MFISVILKSLPLLLKGMLVTVQASLVAIFIGFLFGLIFGVLNSNKIKIKGISSIINLYVLFVRGTPLYVQILIFYFALPDLLGINLSPFIAGSIALGFNSIAYVTEIIRGGINSVPEGQWQAGYVLGYSFLQTLFYIILPQMLKNSIPILTGEAVVLLKDTSLLSAIGMVEMTRVGMNINARILQPMPVYLTVAVFYLGLTTLITMFSKYIEKGLNHDNG